MSHLDYLMIIIFVVGTSLVGVFYQKHIKTTEDYLLAGKRLKWWQIGISQTADAVDATDFVAAFSQPLVRSGLHPLRGGPGLDSLCLREANPDIWMGHTLWRPIWAFLAAWVGLFLCSHVENRIFGQRPEDGFARSLNIHALGTLKLGEKEREKLKEMAHQRERAVEFSEVPEPGIPPGTPWYLHPTFFEAIAIGFLVFFLVLWW